MKNTLFIFVFLPILAALPHSGHSNNESPLLLLANDLDVCIIPAQNPNNTVSVVNKLAQATACDFIYEDQLIFWIDEMDFGKSKIEFTNMSGSHRRKMDVVTSGMEQPDGLACDWVGKKIYFSDAEAHHIEVCELNGSSRKVLIWKDIDQPRAIAVDPSDAYIYWTDWGENPKIERAGMDGTRRQVLVNDDIYWPNGITLDYEERKVYWVEANYHFIHRINMDGTHREEVISGDRIKQSFSDSHNPFASPTPKITPPATNLPQSPYGQDSDESEEDLQLLGALQHPFAITLFEDLIYWTDWATYSVHSLPKNGSGLPVLVKGSDISPMDIHVYSGKRQKPGRNPCGSNNGGCSHLCLLSPDPPHYRCACPTGVQMMQDNKTCENGPKNILLLARRADLRVISLDTDDHTDVLIPVPNVEHAIAVEYDPLEQYVYWTDDGRKAILRVHLNGSGSEAIITDNVEQSDGIAIDWIARNLYWTDTGRDYIAVSRLNGTSKKILIESGIDEPRAIVLDPLAGHMYWSDWGNNPKIERADLDGSDRLIFVDTDVVWPNGLAIDHRHSLLFWADASGDRIEKIFLNGTGRKVLLSEEIPHIFGLSLLGNYLYWTDWQRRRIERMRVGDRRSRRIVIDQLPDIFGVKATSMNVPPGTNPCAIDNGGCSHLCLYTSRGPKCHCPTGLELASSMKHCIVPEAFLLFSFTQSGGIRKLSLDTASGSSKIPFKTRVDASFLDFSSTDNRIYWTNSKNMTILRSFLNGTNIEHFMDIGIEMLEGLAVDWIGRNVYWADSSANRIEVAHMDMSCRRSVVWKNIESPRCLALDPANGYIYWSEWGSEPCIKRAEMNGANVTQINKVKIGRANSLTIDYAQMKLYWVDFDINAIMRSNMNGSGLVRLIAGEGHRSILSLTLYGDHLYWSDSKLKSIERADKADGNNMIVVQSDLNDVDDVVVYHASRQKGVTSCAHKNGGCQHFCFSLPGGKHTCACPAHYILNKDNVTCTAPTNFLLMSQTRYFTRIIFKLPGGQLAVVPEDRRSKSRKKNRAQPSPDAVLPIRGVDNACSLDFDPIGMRIYWLDCKLGEIRSARQDGTQVQVLLPGNASLHKPYDIAVDVYSRFLYWTDALTNSIKLMKLDGTPVGTVLSEFVSLPGGRTRVDILPRKIVVDTMRGRLYFTNTCENINSCRLKIMQSALDGSDCNIWFSRDLHNVTAMAVDSATGRLYWADRSRIESSKLDGSVRTVLVDTGLTEPVGLTIFGPDLYWVDAKEDGGVIEAASKSNGKSRRRKIQSRIKNLRDIVSVIAMNESALNHHPCSGDNGGCSHICVTNDDGSTRCSCPSHLSLVEDFKCVEPSTCGPDQFTCKRTHQCIPIGWLCDGRVECSDKTDELDCGTSRDCDGKFSCGIVNSASSSDKVLLHSLISAHPQCLDTELVCDGREDCINGVDERNCPACKHGEKPCNGQCVAASSSCRDCQGICPPGPHGAEQDNTIVIVIGIICGCVFLLAGGLFVRHCTMHDNNHYPPGVVTFIPSSNGHLNLNVEFQTHDDANPPRTTVTGGRKKSQFFNLSFGPPGSTQGSVSHAPMSTRAWSSYRSRRIPERPHIPGASSTSSTKRIPPNFYQSPNDTCVGDYFCSSDSPSVRTSSYYRCRNGHKHRRHYKPTGPPPTPCTTDTCEDLDGRSCHLSKSGSVPHEPPPPYYGRHSCCYHCYHQYNHTQTSSSGSVSSHHCRGDCSEPPSYDPYRVGRRRHYNRQFSGMNSDSDPYAPPPTPRSQYMSECCDTTEVEDAPEVEAITNRINLDLKEDDEETVLLSPSRANSPSTERSYRTLLFHNPPPSPVTDSS